jgi:hypothetical protein
VLSCGHTKYGRLRHKHGEVGILLKKLHFLPDSSAACLVSMLNGPLDTMATAGKALLNAHAFAVLTADAVVLDTVSLTRDQIDLVSMEALTAALIDSGMVITPLS